jgi:hypothetical protein
MPCNCELNILFFGHLIHHRDWGASSCHKELPYAASIVREALWWRQPLPLLILFFYSLHDTLLLISWNSNGKSTSLWDVSVISQFHLSSFYVTTGTTSDISNPFLQSMEMKNVLEMDPYEEQFNRSTDPEVPFPGISFFLIAWFCLILPYLAWVSHLFSTCANPGIYHNVVGWNRLAFNVFYDQRVVNHFHPKAPLLVGVYFCTEMDWSKPSGLDDFLVYSCLEEDLPDVPDNWTLVKSPPSQKPKLRKPAARTWRWRMPLP